MEFEQQQPSAAPQAAPKESAPVLGIDEKLQVLAKQFPEQNPEQQKASLDLVKTQEQLGALRGALTAAGVFVSPEIKKMLDQRETELVAPLASKDEEPGYIEKVIGKNAAEGMGSMFTKGWENVKKMPGVSAVAGFFGVTLPESFASAKEGFAWLWRKILVHGGSSLKSLVNGFTFGFGGAGIENMQKVAVLQDTLHNKVAAMQKKLKEQKREVKLVVDDTLVSTEELTDVRVSDAKQLPALLNLFLNEALRKESRTRTITVSFAALEEFAFNNPKPLNVAAATAQVAPAAAPAAAPTPAPAQTATTPPSK